MGIPPAEKRPGFAQLGGIMGLSILAVIVAQGAIVAFLYAVNTLGPIFFPLP